MTGLPGVTCPPGCLGVPALSEPGKEGGIDTVSLLLPGNQSAVSEDLLSDVECLPGGGGAISSFQSAHRSSPPSDLFCEDDGGAEGWSLISQS